MYQDESGRLKNVPSVKMLKEAIEGGVQKAGS
jgi:hypothetical protein